MASPKSGRAAAIIGALVLLTGGVTLWLGADRGEAGAATARPPENSLPAIAAEPGADLAPAPPERARSKEEQRFARADRDDDGRVTQAEYLQQRRRNFDKLDANGDGRLEFSEYATSGIEKFSKADADRNGQLAPAEFATTAPKPKNRQMASVDGCSCPSGQTALSSADATGD
jgi:hypothetical protein